MPIRLEIIADTFGGMIQELQGAVRLFVAPPQAQQQPMQAEPEIIEPAKKLRAKKPAPPVIEGTANVVEAEPAAPESEADQPAEQAVAPAVLDFEKHIRPKLVAAVNDLSDKDDPDSQKKLFVEITGHVGVRKASEIKPEDYQKVLDYIAAKYAAAGKSASVH